jgi:hypothetical protein
MRAQARWVLHLVRSPRCREYAVRAITAVLLLGPILLLALDHHGAERIPTHSHVEPLAQAAPPHVHGFEVRHVDTPVRNVEPPATPSVVAPEPAAVLVLSFAQVLGMPLDRAPIVMTSGPQDTARQRAVLADQTTADPPTPPPTALG